MKKTIHTGNDTTTMSGEIERLQNDIQKLKQEHALGRQLIINADRYRALSRIDEQRTKVIEDRESVSKNVDDLQKQVSDTVLLLNKGLFALNDDNKKLWGKFWEQCKTELNILEPQW
jgi:predicted phage tail protein